MMGGIVAGVALAGMAAFAVQADPPNGRAMPPQPIAPNGSWMTDEDYPAEARKNGQQGTTGFVLTVSSSGKVTACRITQTSGSEVLDQATCAVMVRNMRFRPARDAAGKAVEGEVTSRFTWKLPK